MIVKTVLYHTVGSPWLASEMKSGSLNVLATPAMIAWMEETACLALDLPEGMTSVGIALETDHKAASAPGTRVATVASLEDFNGKIAKFKVAAYANGRCIGQGTHVRAVVNVQKFMEKLEKN